MRRLFYTIVACCLVYSQCFGGMIVRKYSGDGGSVTCSGDFDLGQYESFEKGEGQFCTTGWTETDTEGVISTYSSDQSNCGLYSLKITPHTTTTSSVTVTISDDADFSCRFYFNPSIVSTYSNTQFLQLRDGTATSEMFFALRKETSDTYKLYLLGLGTSIYFSPVKDTWYYVVIDWLGNGTTNGTQIKMYNTSGVAQTATGGYDATTIATTETDGISSIRFYSQTTSYTLHIDDVVFSASGADLSGGQTCD